MEIYLQNYQQTIFIDKPTTFFDILLGQNKEFLKKALFIIVNHDDVYDLHTPILANVEKINAEIIYDIHHPKFLEILNHSCAHLLAAAIYNLYPKTKFWVGPAIKEGFYYDIDADNLIEPTDLDKISSEMHRIISANPKISRKNISLSEAKKIFQNNVYKLDLINNIKGELSTYQLGNFVDLCKGPHVFDIKLLKNFKLISISGAYFKGSKDEKMLSRIHGTCWPTQDELQKHLAILEIRKANDHRKIGKEMKLFMLDATIGQGLIVWLPLGMRILERISKYIKEIEIKYGFQHISTPILGTLELYKISGHWKHYHDNMYPLIKIDNEKLLIRPMSCPHHCMVYKNELHSYRELPIRYAEEVIQYRYEASGGLSGLERVRGMKLTDAHIFVDLKHLYKEIKYMLKMIEEVLTKFQINIAYYRLSLHDPKDTINFVKNDDIWNKSESILRDILKHSNYKYVEAVGEAAFYGPKIDVQIETILGREITISTLQLDFLAPKNFKMYFINENNQKEAPIMLHRGLIGTYERFISILIEQTGGVFPFWIAPIQVAIIAIHESHLNYANKINKFLVKKNIFTKTYFGNERLSYKVRDAQLQKIPFQIIIGDNEVATNTVQVRKYNSQKNLNMTMQEFLKFTKK